MGAHIIFRSFWTKNLTRCFLITVITAANPNERRGKFTIGDFHGKPYEDDRAFTVRPQYGAPDIAYNHKRNVQHFQSLHSKKEDHAPYGVSDEVQKEETNLHQQHYRVKTVAHVPSRTEDLNFGNAISDSHHSHRRPSGVDTASYQIKHIEPTQSSSSQIFHDESHSNFDALHNNRKELPYSVSNPQDEVYDDIDQQGLSVPEDIESALKETTELAKVLLPWTDKNYQRIPNNNGSGSYNIHPVQIDDSLRIMSGVGGLVSTLKRVMVVDDPVENMENYVSAEIPVEPSHNFHHDRDFKFTPSSSIVLNEDLWRLNSQSPNAAVNPENPVPVPKSFRDSHMKHEKLLMHGSDPNHIATHVILNESPNHIVSENSYNEEDRNAIPLIFPHERSAESTFNAPQGEYSPGIVLQRAVRGGQTPLHAIVHREIPNIEQENYRRYPFNRYYRIESFDQDIVVPEAGVREISIMDSTGQSTVKDHISNVLSRQQRDKANSGEVYPYVSPLGQTQFAEQAVGGLHNRRTHWTGLTNSLPISLEDNRYINKLRDPGLIGNVDRVKSLHFNNDGGFRNGVSDDLLTGSRPRSGYVDQGTFIYPGGIPSQSEFDSKDFMSFQSPKAYIEIHRDMINTGDQSRTSNIKIEEKGKVSSNDYNRFSTFGETSARNNFESFDRPHHTENNYGESILDPQSHHTDNLRLETGRHFQDDSGISLGEPIHDKQVLYRYGNAFANNHKKHVNPRSYENAGMFGIGHFQGRQGPKRNRNFVRGSPNRMINNRMRQVNGSRKGTHFL